MSFGWTKTSISGSPRPFLTEITDNRLFSTTNYTLSKEAIDYKGSTNQGRARWSAGHWSQDLDPIFIFYQVFLVSRKAPVSNIS